VADTVRRLAEDQGLGELGTDSEFVEWVGHRMIDGMEVGEQLDPAQLVPEYMESRKLHMRTFVQKLGEKAYEYFGPKVAQKLIAAHLKAVKAPKAEQQPSSIAGAPQTTPAPAPVRSQAEHHNPPVVNWGKYNIGI